jgi:hypothetical protein
MNITQKIRVSEDSLSAHQRRRECAGDHTEDTAIDLEGGQRTL